MLGTAFMKKFESGSFEFTATDMDIDITDINVVRDFTKAKGIDWIINCAAYTAVDRAEDDRESAFQINSEGIKNLAIAAREINAAIVHFSTDYVFDGTGDRPYTEEDPVNPAGVYGSSKLQGETGLVNEWGRHFIFRISWLYGEYGKNFVYTMLRLFNSSNTVRVVNDQWGSPTYTEDLADFVISVIQQNSPLYGIYHYSCEGKTSWYEFAREILNSGKRFNLVKGAPVLEGISSAEYATRAKRPDYSYLSKKKLIDSFNITVPHWKDSLGSFLSGLAGKTGSEYF